MYRRLRFCWIVECRTSSIIWIAWPLCSSGLGTAWNSQRHRASRRDLRQRDDAQEQLLPLQPALLDLAEHVAADRAVDRAVDAVVLLLLHREVGPQDLLERVLLRRLLERVVGSVLRPARGTAAPRRVPGSSHEPWPRSGDSSALLPLDIPSSITPLLGGSRSLNMRHATQWETPQQRISRHRPARRSGSWPGVPARPA